VLALDDLLLVQKDLGTPTALEQHGQRHFFLKKVSLQTMRVMRHVIASSAVSILGLPATVLKLQHGLNAACHCWRAHERDFHPKPKPTTIWFRGLHRTSSPAESRV
jgi:hypothetical protein